MKELGLLSVLVIGAMLIPISVGRWRSLDRQVGLGVALIIGALATCWIIVDPSAVVAGFAALPRVPVLFADAVMLLNGIALAALAVFRPKVPRPGGLADIPRQIVAFLQSDLVRYIGRKLLLALPLVWGVITLIFILIEMSPGTVVDKFITPETAPEVRDRLIAKWHLADPAYIRYLFMCKNLALLDFGVSMDQERPVFDIIADALPNTIRLSVVTLLVIYPVGLVLGTFQAVKQGKLADTGTSIGSLFFYSMPSFWLAMMLQLLLTYYWPILPSSGMHDAVRYDDWGSGAQWIDSSKHLVLPGIALGLASCGSIARFMRSSLLEVIRQDYIRTARAKGLPESTIIGKHALRNALIPIITLFGLSLPYLFSGSVLAETIFAWPGMGRLIVTAIFAQDTPLIIACFFVYTLLVVGGNLLADILYAVVDPRIRLA